VEGGDQGGGGAEVEDEVNGIEVALALFDRRLAMKMMDQDRETEYGERGVW
jgi:hypothetical protein